MCSQYYTENKFSVNLLRKNVHVYIIKYFFKLSFLHLYFLSHVQVVEGIYTEGNKVINNVDVILLILNWAPSLSVGNKR